MKSNVSDLLEMVQAIYRDACAKCTADVSDLRDLRTIRSRVKEEGLSFLTITLPNFCSDFEKSLEQGQIDSTRFQNFRKRGRNPAFLQGFVSQLFDHETGRTYDDKNIPREEEESVVVEGVRQICLAFKKIELPCTPSRVRKTFSRFIAVEQDFHSFSVPNEDLAEFRLVSSVLWDNTMVRLRIDRMVPRHGPGATAERISGNSKFVWQKWHERLEPYFPLIDTAYTVGAVENGDLEIVTLIKPECEQPVRVIHVPKTLKGPRIIAIEPVCVQYVQQAIRAALYQAIGSSELTKGHVNFDDQSVNQKLALMASNTNQLATIDLSDASDRVPRDLALEMFRSNPDLQDAIDACRSTRAELPDGTVVSLMKFASMGSALCFPVESMYFYTICVMALLRKHKLSVSHENVLYVSRDVYVYGDDILAPRTDADIVLDYLQKYNCKVNTNKTFLRGPFRESCGVDGYRGEPVQPVYIGTIRPKNRQQAAELISWTATANHFYLKGYWKTAQLMYCTIERILGPLPVVSETSEVLGRVSYLGYLSAGRWNDDYQTYEVNGWVARPVYSSDHIEGYSALQKSFLNLSGLTRPERFLSTKWVSRKRCRWSMVSIAVPDVDKQHLERTAQHGAAVLKRRWSPV